MKLWTQTYHFNHPFSLISSAVWRKYPNIHKPEVTATDTLDRQVTEDGVLQSKRIIASDFGCNQIVRKVLGTEKTVYGFEKSSVDPIKQEMTQESENITFKNRLSIKEKLTYEADGPDKTKLTQETSVTLHSLPWCFQYIVEAGENWIISDIKKNAQKGRDALKWVVERIKHENEMGIPADSRNGMSCTIEDSQTIENPVDSIVEKANKSVNEIVTAVDEMSLKSIAQSVDEIGTKAKKSVDEIGTKAFQSVDEIGYLAKKSVDEIGTKAFQSVDEIGNLAKKSVDEIGTKAFQSVDEIGNLAKKSVDEIGTKAFQSVDEIGDKVIKSVDEFGNIVKSVDREIDDIAIKAKDAAIFHLKSKLESIYYIS